MTILNTRRMHTVVISVLLASLVGTPAFAASTPDAWITTKIKLALLTTQGISSNDVSVDTIDGRVTLHGTVSSEQEKALADQAAHNVSGVQDVRDMLAVVPPHAQKAVAVADDQIQRRVEQALAADKSLGTSKITVASVNNGMVILTGHAATLSDHVQAVEDAHSVPGVRQVASEITSPDTLSDAEIWRDTKWQATGSAPSAGGVVKDAWITTAAKVRLITDSQTPATAINVDTRDGVVTLFGVVPTAAAKHAAEIEVTKVSGVKHVRNELQVVPSEAQTAVQADDAVIKDRIAKRVDDALVDKGNINVDVKGGVVRLRGTVDRQTDRLRALTIARSTDGVRSVVDEIQVTE